MDVSNLMCVPHAAGERKSVAWGINRGELKNKVGIGEIRFIPCGISAVRTGKGIRSHGRNTIRKMKNKWYL